MIREFDTVRVKRDLANVRDSEGNMISLADGRVGTVVMIYDGRVGSSRKKPAYEVDFCDNDGSSVALLTLEQEDIELDRSYASMKSLDGPEQRRRAG